MDWLFVVICSMYIFGAWNVIKCYLGWKASTVIIIFLTILLIKWLMIPESKDITTHIYKSLHI